MSSPHSTDHLAPHFIEACRFLGFMREDAVEWLVGQSHTPEGYLSDPRTIRRNSGQEWRLKLTELGQKSPIDAFDETWWRAISMARRIDQRQGDLKAMKYGMFAGALTCAPPPDDYCAIGKSHAGQLLSEPPILPWPGCTKNYCRCSWRLMSNWEAEQRAGKGEFIDRRHVTNGAEL